MKVILVIGTLNKILNNICECLINEYNVQLCSENYDEISAMIRFTKPDLIIVNEISLDTNEISLYDKLSKIYVNHPIIIITPNENTEHASEISKYLQDVLYIYKPVTRTKLLNTCNILLNSDESADTSITQVQFEANLNERQGTTDTLSQEKPKILVVDDSVILLRNIKAMLEDKYQVFTVTSGEKALEFLPQIKPDIILLDYTMPGWDGKKTFEMLCEDKIGCTIPVIFLTSVSEKQQILDVLMLKPFGYILKPPSKDRITDEIKKALTAVNQTEINT